MSPKAIARTFVAPALALALLAISAAPAAAAEADAAAPAKKVVNVNQASADELARLPRVGAKLADRIVAYRTQHGPFKRPEDLMSVKGIGEKMFTSLRPYVATSGQTTLTEKVSSAKSRSGGKGKGSGKSSRGKSSADTAASR